MSKHILGLDLGSNSVGWALLSETNGQINHIIAMGSRIFSKAVEDKSPTPKNVKRRTMRLGRHVIERRARRKQKMLNYLVSLDLLPQALQGHQQPEILLNRLGDPYQLRAKALDHPLTRYEFGRVLLHFVARRGFLSNKKQMAGDLVDDPDTQVYLAAIQQEIDGQQRTKKVKPKAEDESQDAFHHAIYQLNQQIKQAACRTLGEYLFQREVGKVKRNRKHAGGYLRTDRQMYQDELQQIWQQQQHAFPDLPTNFMEAITLIIFYQRPLKLKADRVGKCSLEPNRKRAAMARLQVQRFRFLQNINNLQYFEVYTEQWLPINTDQKAILVDYLEHYPKLTLSDLKKRLGFARSTQFNLTEKNFKGNLTACEIRNILGTRWDHYSEQEQFDLVEDLLAIKKKSALKTRLINHWQFTREQAVQLSLLELEPGHSNLSLTAINKILPFLKQGLIYSKHDKETGEMGALQAAGYTDETSPQIPQLTLGHPPDTNNPIVNKGLHELKRVVNAIIKHYGKPDMIRIEMARDLEMNTKRYDKYIKQQRRNEKSNEQAVEAYQSLKLGTYPSHDDKTKYRLWLDQDKRCAYSNRIIPLTAVFSNQVQIDHIVPFSRCLDDSYMNKVLCYAAENDYKGDRTPKDAWGGNDEKWTQITQAIKNWQRLDSKVKRFFQTTDDLPSDFISNQLNDTRYIAKLALDYLKQLGRKISVTNGHVVSKIRHQWGLNDLIGDTHEKDRSDHRHHAIDAVVIAATSPRLYREAVKQLKYNNNKLKIAAPYPMLRHDLADQLAKIIVSHASQRKLSGELHEATGIGYSQHHGGLIYRKTLDPQFTVKQAEKIVDDTVRQLVLDHLALYNNNPKKAFADNITLLHKDKKTPIHRVRMFQNPNIKLTKIKQSKFGIKDNSGHIFKWVAYGNFHHVAILQDKKTKKYKGQFVSMMQAAHRARGISSHLNPTGEKQPIIQTDYGEQWQFVMALHINDLVSIITEGGVRKYYKVQKLDQAGKIQITLHSDAHKAKEIPKHHTILKAVTVLMSGQYQLKKHQINAIGIITDD